jgi:hypothetical protein
MQHTNSYRMQVLLEITNLNATWTKQIIDGFQMKPFSIQDS